MKENHLIFIYTEVTYWNNMLNLFHCLTLCYYTLVQSSLSMIVVNANFGGKNKTLSINIIFLCGLKQDIYESKK